MKKKEISESHTTAAQALVRSKEFADFRQYIEEGTGKATGGYAGGNLGQVTTSNVTYLTSMVPSFSYNAANLNLLDQ